MRFELVKTILRKAVDFAEYECNIAFQGGEPTLRGLEFYKKAINYVKTLDSDIKLNFSLQTNGILIDEKWAEFLSRHDFLVGISLDGPKSIHNRFRKTCEGQESFSKVLNAINILKNYNVDFNILTVLHSKSALSPRKIYNHFKDNHLYFMQFIKCREAANNNLKEKINPEIYTNFLKHLFDEWYNDIINGKKVSIRLFDNIILLMLGFQPEFCELQNKCSRQIVVESDGSAFPCDFFVNSSWYLGNIKSKSLENLISKGRINNFIDKSNNYFSSCRGCKWHKFCKGGCMKDWTKKSNSGRTQNIYCNATQEFMEYSYDEFKEIARNIQENFSYRDFASNP